MGFFLVGRVAEDGSLNLLTTAEFSTRQEAIDDLSKMTVDASLESEVFVVDLGVATPVLLVRQQPVETSTDVEPPVELEMESKPDNESSDELTDALKRATGALEDEGIQAPESIGMPEDEPVSESKAPPETETAPPAEPAEDDESWPWAKDGSDAEGYSLDPLEEPSAADDDGILVHAKGGEDTVDLSRPVVMGEYPESEAAVTEEQQVSEDEPSPPPPPTAEESPAPPEPLVPQPVEEPPPPAPAVEPEPEPTEAPAIAEDLSILGDLEIPVSLSEDATQEYAGEEIDLASLTCDDCVYVNTCPNKEDLQPADCGSFQWKSG